MEPNVNRAEAERLLGVAEKLLQQRDLNGSREFAILAQEAEPLLEGSDQILAIADVLLSAERRINNNRLDWYSILQIGRRSDDLDLIKKQYRRLALLLHPDKNKFSYADQAFTLVAEAWNVLSDNRKKSPYDHELSLFTKIDLTAAVPDHNNNNNHNPSMQQHHQHGHKLPVRRGERSSFSKPQNQRESNQRETNENNNNNVYDDEEQRMRLSTFWTACPYCYILYEYPRVYENCCLKCQNCRRGFHGALIPNLPPLVTGKDAYYCCWAVFPLGFTGGNSENSNSDDGDGDGEGSAPGFPKAGFPKWMPPLFTARNGVGGGSDMATGAAPNVGTGTGVAEIPHANVDEEAQPKKRGRPRKNFP